MGRSRIAVLVGQADEDYQKRFIEGLLRRGFEKGFDVCVFSMYRKYQNTAEREEGESSIFSLPNPKKFDGVIFLRIRSRSPARRRRSRRSCMRGFRGRFW